MKKTIAPEERHSGNHEMPSTHQQLLYHIVFGTKNRKPYLANDEQRAKLFAYMAGIAKNLEAFALEIGGWVDHAHLLVRIPAKLAVSDFVGRLKANSSKHVNETSGLIKKFGWQEGFGAFSVSVSQKDHVARYIQHQVSLLRSLSMGTTRSGASRHRLGLYRPSGPDVAKRT